MYAQKLSILFLLIFILWTSHSAIAQLANKYPNDTGIESDPNVIFVEKFDDGMANILSRYSDKRNTAGMSLDSNVHSESIGSAAIKISSIKGTNDGGHLFRLFNPGFDSTVFVRYYVKYPASSAGYIHHESVWFGGYNPATSYPSPKAGICGLGSNRLSIAYEPVHQRTNPPGMDTYLYWGDMKSYNEGANCYGNDMVNNSATAQNVIWDRWMCIEIMIKLNNPITAYNGELQIWQDGMEVGHWGPGFPNGHWLKDSWINDPNDPPFKGFRWRTDASLNINWLWFEFYHDNPLAPSSYIEFDHLVMAKKYIGPISSATGFQSILKISPAIQAYPNPSSGIFNLLGLPSKSKLTVFSVWGEKMFARLQNDSLQSLDLSDYPKGIYLIKVENAKNTYQSKIFLQ